MVALRARQRRRSRYSARRDRRVCDGGFGHPSQERGQVHHPRVRRRGDVRSGGRDEVAAAPQADRHQRGLPEQLAVSSGEGAGRADPPDQVVQAPPVAALRAVAAHHRRVPVHRQLGRGSWVQPCQGGDGAQLGLGDVDVVPVPGQDPVAVDPVGVGQSCWQTRSAALRVVGRVGPAAAGRSRHRHLGLAATGELWGGGA